MEESPLFEEDFDKLFPKKDKKVELPEGNYEYCPECNGEGEVRRAWALTHWQMKPCDHCDGNGYISERTIDQIFKSIVSDDVAQKLNDAFINAGFFFLKKRDIFYIEECTRILIEKEYQDKLDKIKPSNIVPEDEDSMITIPIQYELSATLREAADRRAQTLPNSPQANALYKAADLLIGIYEEGEVNE
jgi:hypothetical protein